MYKLILVLTFAIFLGGCAEVGQQIRKTSCTYELDSAWDELDIAKSTGMSGSANYSKAIGLISLAQTMKTVEKFEKCAKYSKDARYYISQTIQGALEFDPYESKQIAVALH